MSDDSAHQWPPRRSSGSGGAAGSRSVFPDDAEQASRSVFSDHTEPTRRQVDPPPGHRPDQASDLLEPTRVQPGVPPQPAPLPQPPSPATPPLGVPAQHGSRPPAAYPPGAPAYGPYGDAGPYGNRRQPAARSGPGQRRPPSEPRGRRSPRTAPSVPGLQRPWLGAFIAAAGVIVLWVATQSLAWIDSAASTLTLTELGHTAEGLGEFRFVRWYADWGWMVLAGYVTYVAVLATLVNPTSRAVRTLLWLPVAGFFAFFNLTDSDGKAAPRVLGALTMLVPAALLGAIWVDLLVDPKLDPSLEGVSVSEPDQQDLANGDAGSVDIDALETLGVDWRGFSSGEIGNGLWLSFAALAIVAVGAVAGTRAARR